MTVTTVLPKNKIADVLAEQGRTIYWLSYETRMSYQALHKLIRSERIPAGTNYGTLAKIATALDVPISALSEPEQGQ